MPTVKQAERESVVEKSLFATNLGRLRKKAGLTQEQLGEAVGVGHFQISRWERGAHSPRVDELPGLAKALKCKTDDFYAKGKA